MDGKHVETVEELIAALGGTGAAAQALDATSNKIVNWRAAGRLPSRLYFVHRRILNERGINAAPGMWGFELPESETAA